MPACFPWGFPPAAAALSRTRARTNAAARLVSAASSESRGMRRLLPVAAAVLMMITSAALGVARAQGTWSTASLSVARCCPAAASVGNVALFAGGSLGGSLDGVLMVAWVLSVCASRRAAVLWFCLPLQPLAASRAPLQMVSLQLWTCTTVQQGRGRRLSSAWRAFGLQLHLLGTWLCSLGV